MSDVFMDKNSWLVFAVAHNSSADFNATQLKGSDSYTLAGIYLSAGVPIPKSVLLDTKRAYGKFVADHFCGLRQLYESGIESRKWLPDILRQCQEVAGYYSLDSDKVIQKLIDITEKKDRSHNKPHSVEIIRQHFDNSQQRVINDTRIYDDDDIKI